MSYIYAWYGNDDDLFYIGVSTKCSKIGSRSKRMIGVTHTNKQLSRAEQYYYKRNRDQLPTTVKIIKDGLSDHEGLLLESALIIRYKNILLNSNHLKLNLKQGRAFPDDIFDLADSLLLEIKNGVIKHTNRILIWQKPKLIYVDYYTDRYDIITPKSFQEQFGCKLKSFLKLHDPRYYNIKSIGIEYEDAELYYDRFRF